MDIYTYYNENAAGASIHNLDSDIEIESFHIDLSEEEKRYNKVDKERLITVIAVATFLRYIDDRPFKLISNNMGSAIFFWHDILGDIDFEIMYTRQRT